MASLQDLEGAVNALRGEISGIVAPQIAASITSFRAEIGTTVTAAPSELRSHSETISQRVSVAVEERLQHASTGLSAEQQRLNALMHKEHERLTQAQVAIEELLATLKVDVETAVGKLSAVSDGKLEQVASVLIEQQATLDKYRVDQDLKVGAAREVLSIEVRKMHQSHTEVNTVTLGRMDQLELVVGAQMRDRPVDWNFSSPGGARGYQIRIPDPKLWNLTVLKNGETGFLPWRKSFELQVRAIWAGLDVVLEALQEEVTGRQRSLKQTCQRAHPRRCQSHRLGLQTLFQQAIQRVACTPGCRSNQDR